MEKLLTVPQSPGVYLMRNAQGHIIYIGKAKNLKSRLSSYFKSGSHDAKTTAMITKITDFDYFLTATENDALALEANLINQYKPHYNILLKDNKSFPYLKITNTTIEITRRVCSSQGRAHRARNSPTYFGPYFNGIWAKDLMDTLYDLFPLERAGKNKLKPINDCLGDVKAFLRGEKEFNARETLTEKMNRAAELEQFEIAIRYRNGISFLDKLKERTITQVGRDLNLDIFAHATSGEVVVFSVLTVRAGKLIGIHNYSETISIEDDLLESFIRQYYLTHPEPDQVLLDAKQGVKKKLLDMAMANAKEYLETSIEKIKFKQEFTIGACKELGKLLGIPAPKKIECFDISHTHGTETVASMVAFIHGVPERKLYRKFKIRSHTKNDDYLSMREVISRRLNRTEWDYPDLIVLDGGKGQLSTVMALNPKIAVIALAKENEEIFTPNSSDPIILPKRSYALRLLQRIRDEAHRFANDYRKKLHQKNRV
ncbi:MAG: excinuclease ABC subunit UvrC [Firmicutes bacterium]|nr:excinuclease ABC subunit UvrC [Bacillota bacterium]